MTQEERRVHREEWLSNKAGWKATNLELVLGVWRLPQAGREWRQERGMEKGRSDLPNKGSSQTKSRLPGHGSGARLVGLRTVSGQGNKAKGRSDLPSTGRSQTIPVFWKLMMADLGCHCNIPGKNNLNWRTASIRVVCGHVCRAVLDC